MDFNEKQFQDKLLKEKIEKFKKTVEKAAKSFGISTPKVKIWDCPEMTEDTIAHCHIDKKIICISELRLKSSNMDEIYDTATHEVSHILHGNHGAGFHQVHQRVKTDIWEPPSGVSFIRGNESAIYKMYSIDKSPHPESNWGNPGSAEF